MKRTENVYLNVKYATGGAKRISGHRVHTGQILELRSICAAYQNIAADEVVIIQVHEQGVYIPLHVNAVRKGGDWLLWTGKIAIGEGDNVAAYFGSIADTERMYMTYFGVMWDVEQWRKNGN